MKEYESMTKEELIEMLKTKQGRGRKEEVLDLVKEGRISIEGIAAKVGITNRNVSTLLSYLRKDGYAFGKDSKGRIYIEED